MAERRWFHTTIALDARISMMPEKFKSDSGEIRKTVFPYVKDWEDDDESGASIWLRRIKNVLKDNKFDLNPETKILEVGSGKGLLLKKMREEGFNCVGIDARPRAPREEPQIKGRIERLPFADGAFDVVVSAFVFDASNYHQHPNLMAEEIARVLRPGGLYIGGESKFPNQPNLIPAAHHQSYAPVLQKI